MEPLRSLFFCHVAQTSPAPLGIEIEHAEGIFLYGPGGQKYLDLISGISVSNLGHGHPQVIKAIQEQAANYLHLLVYGEMVQAPQVKLAALLCSLLPPSLNSVYFVNSGAEAVEGALKLAKRYTHRTELVCLKQAYHGSTHGALSVMGEETLKQPFRPLLPGVRQIHLNKTDELELVTRKTAAVIIEPVQGEAGVRVAEPEYLKALRLRCDEMGCLLIFDEIQSGLGRTGKLFAFENSGVVPDILLVAKAFGGGMPLGAFVASREIMQSLAQDPALGHITTFGGHPVCCAAGLASLQEICSTRIFESVPEKEQIFRETLVHPAVQEIRSAGLLMAVELGSAAKVQDTIKKCLQLGLITDWFLFCDTALRIAPPLIISPEEIKLAAKIILEALD
ncbi:MAG: aspartate aminotransferase family protein [Bacteroidales bacterium]